MPWLCVRSRSLAELVTNLDNVDGSFYLDRGEGANHAIQDVVEFAECVTPRLVQRKDMADLRKGLDTYENLVTERTRPAVLSSRRASLDAHDWPKISPTSPLLTRREMRLQFDESDM